VQTAFVRDRDEGVRRAASNTVTGLASVTGTGKVSGTVSASASASVTGTVTVSASASASCSPRRDAAE
jgi:hypothetical protein